jgi:hypothetical protein
MCVSHLPSYLLHFASQSESKQEQSGNGWFYITYCPSAILPKTSYIKFVHLPSYICHLTSFFPYLPSHLPSYICHLTSFFPYLPSHLPSYIIHLTSLFPSLHIP